MSLTTSLFSVSDIPTLQANRLMQALANFAPDFTPDPDDLLLQLQAAEQEVAQRLRVYLVPTLVLPMPTPDQIAAIPAGQAWDEEPGYDYDPSFFDGDSWGYMKLRQRPVISITSIQFAYPSPQQTFYTIPNDWIRLDKKYGDINLIPATSSFTAPLSAFMLQALGGGKLIPFMMQVTYMAGLQNVRTDVKWANLLNVIYKLAALNVIESLFLPQSGSISADGLSQSLGVDIGKYREQLDTAIDGPKNANGGLRTFIHGVSNTIAGALA